MYNHVLLKSLNLLWKSDTMLSKPRIYILNSTHLINSIKHEHSWKILYVATLTCTKSRLRTCTIFEACIAVLGIQDIFHFTSRDIGYCVQYFGQIQGYWIFRKINYGDICQFIRDTASLLQLGTPLYKSHLLINETKHIQMYDEKYFF